MDNLSLLMLYYQLSGEAWSLQDKRAVFSTAEDAQTFKAAAPGWNVFWLRRSWES